MSRGRFTAWPSYVDLFSALLITFLGFAVISLGRTRDIRTKVTQVTKELDETKAKLRQVTEAQQRATAIFESVKKDFEDAKIIDSAQTTDEELCLNIQLGFDRNHDDPGRFTPEDLRKLSEAARLLREKIRGPIEGSRIGWREVVQVVVEGHTDETQARVVDQRERFRFNWNLSAQRASAVLYELRKELDRLDRDGDATSLNLSCWGRADSDQLCDPGVREDPEACRALNRRTTIRLKFDYARFKKLRGTEAGKDG